MTDDLEIELVDLFAWPQLREISWSRHDRWIPGAEALALYERNWRCVDESALTPAERAFIDALARRYNPDGQLHIKPPPWGGEVMPGRAVGVEAFANETQDDGELTDAQLERIRQLVREQHGEGTIVKSLFGDEQLARTMATFERLEKQMWPVLAALGHELDADQVPTRSAAEWLWSRSPAAAAAGVSEQPGKWIVEMEGQSADDLWALVHGAVQIGKLWAAKCSSLPRASSWGGRHAVIVYVPGDLEAARAARAVLRELGVREPIRYIAGDGAELLRD